MGASSTKAHSRSKRGALVWDEDDAQQRRHCIHANIPSAARENDKFVMRRTKKYSTNNPTRMAHHVSKRFSNRRADHTISAGDKRMPVDILLIYYGASLSSPLPWNEERDVSEHSPCSWSRIRDFALCRILPFKICRLGKQTSIRQRASDADKAFLLRESDRGPVQPSSWRDMAREPESP